jgi:hypothetical protein
MVFVGIAVLAVLAILALLLVLALAAAARGPDRRDANGGMLATLAQVRNPKGSRR